VEQILPTAAAFSRRQPLQPALIDVQSLITEYTNLLKVYALASDRAQDHAAKRSRKRALVESRQLRHRSSTSR